MNEIISTKYCNLLDINKIPTPIQGMTMLIQTKRSLNFILNYLLTSFARSDISFKMYIKSSLNFIERF
jgi:hypothetical protein